MMKSGAVGSTSSMTIGGGANSNGGGAGTSNGKSQTLAERLNFNNGEVRELKLGCTFKSRNTASAFHTIKYDFKPASVDFNKVATFDVETNNLVTVTVPNLESSGVPQTVYKGNHKKYTKECIMIIDRETGVFTLEKLNHNILVKKTRAAAGGGSGVGVSTPQVSSTGGVGKLENSTMRISSKTKVSTGHRKNSNNIIGFSPRNMQQPVGIPQPMQQQSSPIHHHPPQHKSPPSAPAWQKNTAQATLPSVPMLMDDDEDFGSPNNFPQQQQQQQQQQPQQQQYQPPQPKLNREIKEPKSKHPKHYQPNNQQQQQTQHLKHQVHNSNFNNSNSLMGGGGSHTGGVSNTTNGSLEKIDVDSIPMSMLPTFNMEAINENEVGILSSSDSSSESGSDSSSDSSDSDSDDDSVAAGKNGQQQQNNHNQLPNLNHYQQEPQNHHVQSFTNGSNLFPASLHDDLQLSNSSSEED